MEKAAEPARRSEGDSQVGQARSEPSAGEVQQSFRRGQPCPSHTRRKTWNSIRLFLVKFRRRMRDQSQTPPDHKALRRCIMAETKSTLEAFWDKVDVKGPADCWIWTRGTSRGYGLAAFKGKQRRAHRISWELTHGPIPKGDGYHGTCVLHRCDNSLCVNPNHLFLGSQSENMADRDAKKRQAHTRGPANGCAKITESDVKAIREAVGYRKDIAARFGISIGNVSRIRARRRWSHVS